MAVQKGACEAATSRRAQSETIGVLLLTGVVVVLVTVVGAGVISNFSSQAEAGGISADAGVNVTADNVTVTHRGGDTLPDSTVRVIVRNGSEERQYELSTDAISRTGDGDGRLDPGERATFAHSLSGTVSVLVVDTERNAVIGRGETRVADTGDDPPDFVVRIGNTDSPVAEGETLTVRPTVINRGDREATQQVELSIDGQGVVATQPLTLAAGESEQLALSWDTVSGDAGNYTATVASANDTDTAPVTVRTPTFFAVTIDDTNSPVEERTNLTVNATVENTGEDPGSQEVDLDIPGVGSPFDFERVGLDGGDSRQVTLKNITTSGDAGSYTATVASDDDSKTVPVTITAGEPIVDSIVVEGAPVNYTDAAATGRNVTITFDEPMNQSVDPTVRVRNATNSSVADVGWTATDTYVARIDISQTDEDVVAAVNVSGGEDQDGNVQIPAEQTFLVDTQRPGKVNDVTVRPDINASNQNAVTYGVVNPDTVYGDEDIRVMLTGSAGTTVTNRTPLQGGAGDVTDVTFDASTLTDGNATVAVEAVAIDDLNNTGATFQPSNVTKDTVAPAVSDYQVTSQENGEFTITFNATEQTTAIETVGIAVNGPGVIDSKLNSNNNTVGDTTSYALTYSVTEPGPYDVKLVNILDSVGNNGSAGEIQSIVVDAPTEFRSTTVTDNSDPNGQPAEFTIEYETNNTFFKNVTVIVEPSSGGGRQEFTSTAQTGAFSYTDSNSGKQEYTITYRVYADNGTIEDTVSKTETSGQGGGPPDNPGNGNSGASARS